MTTWVALLRGINVGGRNRLPMADLKQIFADLGCEKVNTYIQSGNVIFVATIGSANRFCGRVAAAIDADFGFRPDVHLVTGKEFEKAITSNPFPNAVEDPKSLHVAFLDDVPDDEHVDRAKELLAPSESCELIGRHLYLHAPDGIARSKFAARMEKTLGVGATARNWRSTMKIMAIAADIAD
ncbi:MAG: DUF1697 domain-containing protein [Woeseiaceae bacterium]|nr:DUF1697 domain-containing protein [Woeseiaceae bacterium]